MSKSPTQQLTNSTSTSELTVGSSKTTLYQAACPPYTVVQNHCLLYSPVEPFNKCKCKNGVGGDGMRKLCRETGLDKIRNTVEFSPEQDAPPPPSSSSTSSSSSSTSSTSSSLNHLQARYPAGPPLNPPLDQEVPHRQLVPSTLGSLGQVHSMVKVGAQDQARSPVMVGARSRHSVRRW
ncbi:hypothetical protein Tco_0569130 [Tanacetum coccineum]